MASSLTLLRRRPRFSSSPSIPLPWRIPVRFATSRGGGMAIPKQKPQPSVRVSQSAVGNQQLPSDVGILEGTFIMPTGANRPSFFSSPKERLRLEWRRLKIHAIDLFSVLVYTRIAKTKPRPRILFRQTAPTAVALHRQMYTAFAEGDIETLRRMACDGLRETLKSRIQSRPRGSKFVWSLSTYTNAPRVVSNRAATLPIDGSGLRQAVVRIQSRQSLTRYGPDGKAVPGTGLERELKEYVVIQKMLWEGKEGPWMVWGTMEESSLNGKLPTKPGTL